MNAEGKEPVIDFTVNTNNLYREENITDLNVASIRRMIPVKLDGTTDESRTELYFGHTQLMSPQGPVPLHAAIPANNIAEALAAFPTAMKGAFDKMVEKMRKAQEEQKKKEMDKKKEDKKD